MADQPDPGTDGEVTGDAADEDRGGSASPLVFLLGLVAFVGSVLAFVADLATGHDVLRSLLVNAASAAVLVWWAAADTLSDPGSDVTTRKGAAGTGLLLLGLYLLAGAVVVGVTSLVHDRFDVVPWAAGLGVLAVVVGFLVFPRGAVLGEEATPSDDGAVVTDATGEGGEESNDTDATAGSGRGEDGTGEPGR